MVRLSDFLVASDQSECFFFCYPAIEYSKQCLTFFFSLGMWKGMVSHSLTTLSN